MTVLYAYEAHILTIVLASVGLGVSLAVYAIILAAQAASGRVGR